jgi:hypothetical protein
LDPGSCPLITTLVLPLINFCVHCLHPVVYHDWWDLAVNTTIKIKLKIKINQSNRSHWFYLIVGTYFGQHMGPSAGSLIKHISCCLNILIWININVTHHNHVNTQPSRSCKNFTNFKIFQNLKIIYIILSLNVKFYVVFVFLSRIVGCPSLRVRCHTT